MSDNHAQASPSGAHGWMKCTQWLPDSKGNPFSREGTCSHTFAARALTEGKDARDYIGMIDVVDGEEIIFDENMADYIQIYIDDIRRLSKDHTLLVEQRISISEFTDEPGAEGTADAVLIPTTGRCLPVRDLKTGYRHVAAKDNPQLMIYGLGVLHRFGMTGDYDSLLLGIHQARLNQIDEWEVSVEDLLDFAKVVKIKAKAYLDPNKPIVYSPDEDACEHCARLADCPAHRELVATQTSADFDNLNQGELPVSEDPEWLSKAMDKVPVIENWTKAVRAKLEANLLSGIAVPRYKLVEGRKGKRSWVDDDEAEKMLKSMRLNTEQMYDLSVKSPTKIEKIIAENHPMKWERLQTIITQKQGKPSVAHVSDPRPALEVNPIEDFDNIEKPKSLKHKTGE